MPLATRPISPVHLASRGAGASCSSMACPREAVTNTTLCQAMRQLASLLKQADDLFQDLGGQVGECRVLGWMGGRCSRAVWCNMRPFASVGCRC